MFSVSDLNNYIKNIFENNRTLTSVTVRGEISNFTNHRSGHLYFSLKDSGGQIRAVMFKSRAVSLKFMPESGMKVVVHGSVTVYPRDGSYQIYVSLMQPDGIGALYLAYEQMKARLAEEGLFDDDHKMPIPALPQRIGIITSPTGAAIRDIINVTGRRFPLADIYLYPALVQGEGAEASLIKALDYLDQSRLCDVIIIGRGGGSIEDLWAFNSEKLARRIYEANTPIISAVGHETDFTICDFVSDLRAPTPSAAAELAVPDSYELLMRVDSLSERASMGLVRLTSRARERLTSLAERANESAVTAKIAAKKESVERLYDKAEYIVRNMLNNKRENLAAIAARADALSPLSTLMRGYSIVEHNGKVINKKSELKTDDEITLIMSDGRIKGRVTDVSKEN
ncbi:MAG: exodeoxyribonuclease VII large subunit [Clostridia bacterium]|nr:exodeoxyribonuclease VII large subunit [Clostridia bacterium]